MLIQNQTHRVGRIKYKAIKILKNEPLKVEQRNAIKSYLITAKSNAKLTIFNHLSLIDKEHPQHGQVR